MTRARVKALHDEVNSLLTTLDLGTPLDGLLPHADVLCVIRYKEHQGHQEEDTPWSKGGEEQLDKKMDRKPPEERKEEKTDGRSRTRSDRLPDRITRSTARSDRPPDRTARSATGICARDIRATSRGLGTSSGCRPVPGPVWTGLPGPRPGLTGSLTGLTNLSRPIGPNLFPSYLFGP